MRKVVKGIVAGAACGLLSIALFAPAGAQTAAPSAPLQATPQPANAKLMAPTPITQSSLPNSPKYKYEPRARVPDTAMRSMQAGNGISRTRQ
jgi:hypothetical protein